MTENTENKNTGPQNASIMDPPPEAIAERSVVSFQLDKSAKQLLAVLTPSPKASPTSLSLLKNRLQAEGFGDLLIDSKILEDIVTRAAAAESGRFLVGECQDAKITVNIANNKQTAHLDIIPAYGGEPLTRESLRQLLSDQGLAGRCCLEKNIGQAVAQTQRKTPLEGLLVAKAIDPIPGKDGWFETLAEEKTSRQPQEDSEGNVDLRDLHDFIVLDPGAPLMRRIPPTEGKPGVDVLGNPIEPKTGRDVKFADKLDGTQLDPADPNLLVAALKGHPVVSANGVRIDPTLVLKGVNVGSGNIQFDGSVDIRGNIESSYRVEASGDVVVKGIIDKATVIAGGSIHVSGGVIGEEFGKDSSVHKNENQDAEQVEPSFKAQLTAGNDITARFMSMAKVSAGACIKVREYLLHCQVSAGDQVALGLEGGKGAIIGGCTQAAKVVVAKILGNEAYISTRVTVGQEKEIAGQLQALKVQRKRRCHEQEQLNGIWAKLNSVSPTGTMTEAALAKVQKISNALVAIEGQLLILDEAIEDRVRQLEEREQALVDVKQRLYPNVKITIDGASETRNRECGVVTLVNEGNEIKEVSP